MAWLAAWMGGAAAGLCASLLPAVAEEAASGVADDSIANYLPYDAARASLAASGITYGLVYTGEVYVVSSGGVSRGATYNGLVEGVVDVDMEKLTGWRGATLHANIYYVHGEGPTTKRVQNIFAISNLEGEEALRLDELWLEQSLLDDRLKVKLGSLAADTEFFASEAAGQFLNGTFGWAGILASNMVQGGPAYPLTAMGVRVQYAPTDDLTVLAALFNGGPADPNAENAQLDNRHGTDFRFGDGELLMVEGQYEYSLGLPGTLKLGGWKQFNTGAYTAFRTGLLTDDSHGLYAIVDQQVWKGAGEESVNVFGRISGSPERQSPMDFYFDAGVVFSGVVPGRPEDSFGAAFGYGRISSDLRAVEDLKSHEAVLEINYTAKIAKGVVVIPDFQYVWNPGGGAENPRAPGTRVEDSVILGLRTNVAF